MHITQTRCTRHDEEYTYKYTAGLIPSGKGYPDLGSKIFRDRIVKIIKSRIILYGKNKI